MAITHAAAEYVFSDFLLKEPGGCRLRGVRLELAADKIVTLVSAGLPLLLISLAFAQEISVGAQISCFSPSSFSWRQAAYVDSYCWASLHRPLPKHDAERIPLWLHKMRVMKLLLMDSLMVPARSILSSTSSSTWAIKSHRAEYNSADRYYRMV
ncbi:pannexin-1a isoform X3 [Hemiscyllium ocellatum]|uniref:pannexin-1a isoform X3 n=1 Tax=Hemiscyllium ocellatum TaxID=170820 RepID=UPI0029676942|nr:pannexin-1a isoform X3 [Hemiscyllium ocellatum]